MKTAMLVLLVALSTVLLAHAQDGDGEGPGSNVFIKQPYNAKPPQEHHDGITENVWNMVPETEGSKAHGKVYLRCYSDDKDSFRVDFGGLDKHSVYTVWFASSLKESADRAGIGKPPFSFKTGGGGGAIYQAPLETCPLIKYKWIVVLKHPDGDPKNVDNAVRVLRARMQQE